MPNSKGNQGSNQGGRSQESAKSNRGLASASEQTKKEVSKKGGEASKGSGRGKSNEGR